MHPRRTALIASLVALNAVCLVVALAVNGWWVSRGRDDIALAPAAYSMIVAWVAATAVGGLVAWRRPQHPVGWLFLALGLCFTLLMVNDVYSTWTLQFRPGSLPGGGVSAAFTDANWIPWFPLIAWVLFLTPTGEHLSPRWRRVAVVTALSAVVGFLLSLVAQVEFAPPYDDVENPLLIEPIAPWLNMVRWLSLLVTSIGLVASAVSLIVRWRRSRGEERQQLLWLTLILIPLPLFVGGAWVGGLLQSDVITLLSAGGFIALVPIVAGLSVLRYRLYDVERIVAAAVSWALLTLALVAVYTGIVWAGARLSQAWSPSPAATATVGAVAAALLAMPLYRWFQDRLDRRFNRRAYEAEKVVRAALSEGTAGLDAEPLLRTALADPAIAVAYPGPDGTWAAAHGQQVAPLPDSVDVVRGNRLVARVSFDPDRVEEATVSRVSALVAAELDNTRLRADLEASRRRLAEAQHVERRRIERDLHDGAQQTLLALAFELQAAQLHGEPDLMRQALTRGAATAQSAVHELRDLANGLHPAALADGGLPGVLEDLRRRSALPIAVHADVPRLEPALEFTAWLVIAEAVVNAQKHAVASRLAVDVGAEDGGLRLRVRDDGRGGARPDGSGLRGLRDRVEAAGGRLHIDSGTTGTTVEAVIPCGS